MKKHILPICLTIGIASALCGCSKSESPTTPPSKDEATAPAATTPAATEPATVPAVAATAATAVVETAKSAAVNLASDLVTQAKSAADSQLSPIASELAAKVKTLDTSMVANEVAKAELGSAVKSLVGGQDASALTTAFKLAQVSALTPEQIGLAKEVGNLASAYVVQKNFASLEGAQGDVATIVSSLRKGEITPALPALQNVAQNAHLTASQKDLLSTVADKYAPGLKKAASTVTQSLDTLKKLPGLGK